MGCCHSSSALMQKLMQKQHEDDLAMVERLLNRDQATLDAGTTTLLIWKCRRDPRLVAQATRWLEDHADAKQAFDGVELYLPQLAHMLVHLDVDWPAGTLERFALVVAQQSPHFALQLHWILRAAMEDYAPRPGRVGHELYYRRCAHLDEEIESCVAHTSAVSIELEELFVQGKIDKEELTQRQRLHGLTVAKRMVNDALRPMLSSTGFGTEVRLIDPTVVPHRVAAFEGVVKLFVAGAAGWKTGLAKIEGRSLLVYDFRPSRNKRHGVLKRALPLDRATTVSRDLRVGVDMQWGFELTVSPRKGTSTSFAPVCLRLNSPEARQDWLRHIGEEASRPPRPPPLPIVAAKKKKKKNDVSDEERNDRIGSRRYAFFEAERRFADELVAVAESLRALPREDRQRRLPEFLTAVHIPPHAYLPLCNSTDKWRRVLGIVRDEGVVFNTKQRCPCLIYLETAYEPGFHGVDLANFVHAHVTENDSASSSASRVASSHGLPLLIEEAKQESTAPRNPKVRLSDPNPLGEVFVNDESIVEQLRVVSKKLSIWRDTDPLSSKSNSATAKQAALLESTEEESVASSVAEETRRSIMSPIHAAESPPPPPTVRSASSVTLPPLTPEQEAAHRIRERASRVLDHWSKQFAMASEAGISHAERVFGSQQSQSQRRSDEEETTEPSESSDTTEEEHKKEKRSRRELVQASSGWHEKQEKVRQASQFAPGMPSWAMRAVIVKSNDDLRQEVFVVQLITRYQRHFASKGLAPTTLYLRPYRILALSASTGLIELVPESTSLDKIYSTTRLSAHFDEKFGLIGTPRRDEAVLKFISSLAASAFLEYALAIKDRHNGNILLDSSGRIVHIDFGFVLGIATGGRASLEQASFKLTRDMVKVMGGVGSRGHALFVESFATALVSAREIVDETSALIEVMQYESSFPCFAGGRDAALPFRNRHFPDLTDTDLRKKARRLVAKSLDHSGTYLYDVFQRATNGIAH